MPEASNQAELNSSPLLTPVRITPPSRRTRASARSQPPEIIDLDEEEVVEEKYDRIHFLEADRYLVESEQPLVVESAVRVPKVYSRKKLRREREEDAGNTMVNSAEIEDHTPTISDEHEGQVAEKTQEAKLELVQTWSFKNRYEKAKIPPKPKSPDPPPSKHTGQLVGVKDVKYNPKRKLLGGVKPHNSLSRDGNNPPHKVSGTNGNSAFDLYTNLYHRPDTGVNKRQKLGNGSSTNQGSSTSPIELEEGQSQRGAGPSNMSQTRSYASQRPAPKSRDVAPEYNSVEKLVNQPSKSRARVRPNGPLGSQANGVNGQKRPSLGGAQPNSFKHLEVVDDPISDHEVEVPVPQKKTSTLAVVINSPAKRSPVDYVETPAKHSGPSSKKRILRSSNNPEEAGIASTYFAAGSNLEKVSQDTKSKSKQSLNESRRGYQPGRSSDSYSRTIGADPGSELSVDELAGPSPDSSSRRNRQVAELLIDNSRNQRGLLQKPHTVFDEESPIISDESDSDDLTAKGDIKPTTFSKSTTSKHARNDGVIFTVKQAFSLQHKWLSSKNKEGCLYPPSDTKSHLSFEDANGDIIQSLHLVAKSIHKIVFHPQSSKLILYNTFDQKHPGMQEFFLELGNPHQASTFAENMSIYSKTIRIKKASSTEFLDKAFINKLPNHQKRASASSPIAEDVELIQKNKDRKYERAKVQKERNRPSSSRLIDKMDQVVSDLPHLQEQQVPISSGFYNTGEKSRRQSDLLPGIDTHGTRSATRKRERSVSPPPAPAPVYIPSWTEDNPDWKEGWAKAIVYPHHGKNRSTVDWQDVLRLNEDEFLNDNLIQFYLNFLEQRLLVQKPDIAKRILFMSSFFYLRLASGVPGRAGINYEAVERWTSKFDIFGYDYIVVPVNEAAHWYLAVICNAPKLILPPQEAGIETEVEDQPSETQPASDPEVDAQLKTMSLDEPETKDPAMQPIDLTQGKTIQSVKKGKRKSTAKPIDLSKPRIIILDSLDQTHPRTSTNLKKWLIAEAASKKEFVVPDNSIAGIQGQKGLPLQPNYCDCGVFLLMYLEKFLDSPDNFVHDILSHKYNSRNNPVLLPEAPVKRNEIRALLLYLRDHRSASIDRLMNIAKKYALPPAPVIEDVQPTVIPDEESQSGSRRQQEPKVEANIKSKRRQPDELSVAASASSISAAVPIASIEKNTTANGRQETGSAIGDMPTALQSMFKKVTGIFNGNSVHSQADEPTGREKVPTELKANSRLQESPKSKRVDFPSSTRHAAIPVPARTGQIEQIDLSLPNLEERWDHGSRRGRSFDVYDEDEAHPKAPVRSPADTHSSTTHTVENEYDDQPSNGDIRPRSRDNQMAYEIKDSQHEDMLLPSTEDPLPEPKCITPKSYQPAQNHGDVEIVAIRTSPRTQTQSRQPILHGNKHASDSKQPKSASEKVKKRKAEDTLVQGQRSGDSHQSTGSPSKIRKQPNAENGQQSQ